ncbi:MAG: hypothetical protein O7C98_08880 [Planctomycetota bacterium]|nr:hypothetical protein [Planctomycetota bacterium]
MCYCAVLEWLGTPDRADASQAGELWHYELAGGGEIFLEFHRGLLLQIYR